MRKGARRRRTALLAAACAAVHLGLLALAIQGAPPPRMPVLDDAQRAVRVTLLPHVRPPAPPKLVSIRPPSPPARRPAHLPPAQRPVATPSPPPLALPAPQPAPPAPATGPARGSPEAEQAWARLGRAILGHTGCANPDAAGLNASERAACQDRVGQSLSRARPLPLGISPRKQAAFDNVVSCQEKYDRGTMPAGTDESQGSSIHGLGYIPKAHECPPFGH